MNKLILILPLFFLTMCGEAPVTPPAGALDVDDQLLLKIMDYANGVRPLSNKKTNPTDAINSALDSFWEEQNASDDTTKQEELLQLSSH
tara:strand:+ start:235 stop:501 length:267 start_codon:yes stop_codon:yes gene_type:complete